MVRGSQVHFQSIKVRFRPTFFSDFTLPQNSIILLNAMYRFDVFFPEIKQRRGRRGARSSPAIPSPERGRCAASYPLSPALGLCAHPARLPPAPDHLRSEAVVPLCSSPAPSSPTMTCSQPSYALAFLPQMLKPTFSPSYGLTPAGADGHGGRR
jgi:hypothetical protein